MVALNVQINRAKPRLMQKRTGNATKDDARLSLLGSVELPHPVEAEPTRKGLLGQERLKMAHLLEATEFLISCWILSGDDDRIPTSHGILDRALKGAVKNELCPSWVRDQLHFVDSRIGLQCVELPALLDWAQRAQLTSAPNPSYHSAQVQVSCKVASRMLRDLDVTEGDAEHWGRLLRQGVEKESNSMTADAKPTIDVEF